MNIRKGIHFLALVAVVCFIGSMAAGQYVRQNPGVIYLDATNASTGKIQNNNYPISVTGVVYAPATASKYGILWAGTSSSDKQVPLLKVGSGSSTAPQVLSVRFRIPPQGIVWETDDTGTSASIFIYHDEGNRAK